MADEVEVERERTDLLRESLIGRVIRSARMVEDDLHQSRIVELGLDDGRTVSIGATGSLDDECYLVFDEDSRRG